MIKSLTLRDWKRHANYGVDFRPGLNFVLGRNGSGKSSLLSGIRYGVTGTFVGPASSLVRSGQEIGHVEVDLGEMTVERSLNIAGISQSITTRPAGKTGQDLENELIRLLGADGVFLGQLLFLSEGDIYSEQDAYGVVDRQLQRLLPLDKLTTLRTSAARLRKPLGKSTKADRSELQSARDEIARLSESEAALSSKLSELKTNIEKLSESLAANRQQAFRHSANAEKRRLASIWQGEWQTLRNTNHIADVDPASALRLIISQHRDAEEALHDALTRRGELSGRQETTKMFLDLLAKSTERCPVCRQDLDDAHRSRAVGEQGLELSALEASARSVDEEIISLRGNVDKLQDMIQECQRFVATAPTDVDDGAEASDEIIEGVAALESALGEHQAKYAVNNQEIGAVREKLASTKSQLALEMAVTRAYRRDALLDIVDRSIGEFERAIQSSVLTPIADELQMQWKSYRGDSEWTLGISEKGELCLRRGTDALPYSAMSGGEKMVALILLRLALVCALTGADFVVLDEPLEHLDPRSRRMLISSLNRAIKQGVLRQVIMSTYEESIARRLYLRSEAHAVFMPEPDESRDTS